MANKTMITETEYTKIRNLERIADAMEKLHQVFKSDYPPITQSEYLKVQDILMEWKSRTGDGVRIKRNG